MRIHLSVSYLLRGLLGVSITSVILPAPGHAQQAVIVVRHAEQTLVGSMMDGDPPLNEEGTKRARSLPDRLRSAGVKAIYTSQYARSRETAEPLAKATGAKSYVVPKDDLAALTAHMRQHHAEDIVAVVGHSDTIPAMLKAWGPPPPCSDRQDGIRRLVDRGAAWRGAARCR